MLETLYFLAVIGGSVLVIKASKSEGIRDALSDIKRIVVRKMFWSPWHAFGVLVILFAIASVVVVVTSPRYPAKLSVHVPRPGQTVSTSPVTHTPPTPAPHTSASASASASTTHTSTTSPVETIPTASLGVTDTATRFARLWSVHSDGLMTAHKSTQGWAEHLAPYSTKHLADLLQQTDPSNIPVLNLIGTAHIMTGGDQMAEIAFQTSYCPLDLILVKQSPAWRVDQVSLLTGTVGCAH